MIETFLQILLWFLIGLVAYILLGGAVMLVLYRFFETEPAAPECYHSVPSEQQQAEYCCEECVHHKSCQGE